MCPFSFVLFKSSVEKQMKNSQIIKSVLQRKKIISTVTIYSSWKYAKIRFTFRFDVIKNVILPVTSGAVKWS